LVKRENWLALSHLPEGNICPLLERERDELNVLKSDMREEPSRSYNVIE
jgi:hypothetical protein